MTVQRRAESSTAPALDGAERSAPASSLTEHKHRAAVRVTLRWADEAAARSQYGEALAWLETIEAIGDEIPAAYQAKREQWRAARHRQARSRRLGATA